VILEDLQVSQSGFCAVSQGIYTTTPSGPFCVHVLAAIAEFEHDLIVERTVEGLAVARVRGRKGGAKLKMTPTRIQQSRAMYDTGDDTVQEIANTFGTSRQTIFRHLVASSKPVESGVLT